MKRKLASIFACLMVLLNLVVIEVAQAQPLMEISLPGLQNIKLTEPQVDLQKQLETDLLPQLESILTPEQRDQFKSEISEGSSLRKAFKSMSLTPDQKDKLTDVFKSLPKKDIFATLTPEQKKALFMKKKELFMPTPEEISDKINQKMMKQ